MRKSIVSEGRTTAEAIEKGLDILKVTKDKVDIKVLEDEKRSFFSILAPRVVKVEITVKDNKENELENKHNYSNKHSKKEYRDYKKMTVNETEIQHVMEELNKFLVEFFKKLKREDVSFEIRKESFYIFVDIKGEKLNYLIGYRGETLNALQTVLTSIASKNSKEKVKVLIDIENYRQKREKALEELAEKIAKTVMRTKKTITLEPMTSYERKIIHSKLQENPNVKTFSMGTEPYRKVVVSIK